jgi:DNA-binding HxlR family transcriptional regulator
MTPRKNFDHLDTGLAKALAVVGEWWSPLIVASIHEGNYRFESIQASLDIARNILTDRLTTLVDANVVHKVEYNNRPKRFEYQLTETGLALIPIFNDLGVWGSKWFNNQDDSVDIPAKA